MFGNWKIEKLRNWEIEKLKNWKIEKLKNWEIEKLKNWKIEKLRNWEIEKLKKFPLEWIWIPSYLSPIFWLVFWVVSSPNFSDNLKWCKENEKLHESWKPMKAVWKLDELKTGWVENWCPYWALNVFLAVSWPALHSKSSNWNSGTMTAWLYVVDV